MPNYRLKKKTKKVRKTIEMKSTDKLTFGKHEGLTIVDIQQMDYSYFVWLNRQKWFQIIG